VGCGPVGGLPTNDPFLQPAGFPGTPYHQPNPVPYAQPMSQQPVRQVTTLPRPQFEPTRPSQAAAVEILPSPEQVAVPQIVVPSPRQLGIQLDEPWAQPVVVPEPEKLGIKPE
jgi:hypothetical protein